MGIRKSLLRMCSRPEGWVGTMMLRMMNMSHSPYARWHLSFVDWHDDWTVLDEGCGGGKNIKRLLKLCPKGKVYGIDYSPQSVALSRRVNAAELDKRCFIVEGDAMSVPFGDAQFDVVTAFETVYFWPDLKKSFGETFRVLKPGGMFMFSYGDENNKWMQNWAKHIDAMRVLPIAELRTILKEVGFADIKILKKRDLTYHVEAIK